MCKIVVVFRRNIFFRFSLYEISKEQFGKIRKFYKFFLKINDMQHWKRVFSKNNKKKERVDFIHTMYIFSLY